MGDVVGFRRAKLTGFIPDDLGADAMERRKADQLARDRQISLIGFAKTGQPVDCGDAGTNCIDP